jgi:hypothetical protein
MTIILMNGNGAFSLDMLWAWVLGLAILVGIIVVFARRTPRGKGHGPDGESTLDVIKDRYRRGEITQSEYDSEKQKYVKPHLHKDKMFIEHPIVTDGIPGEPVEPKDPASET